MIVVVESNSWKCEKKAAGIEFDGNGLARLLQMDDWPYEE